MNTSNIQSTDQSVYAERPHEETIEKHTLAIILANEPGALGRVVGLFSARGYNIDSLTVGEIDHEKGMSRISIVSSGTSDVIAQIIAQLERLVPVQTVMDLTMLGDYVQREVILVRIAADRDAQAELLDVLKEQDIQIARQDDENILIQWAGKSSQVPAFMGLLEPYEIMCSSRTGVAALSWQKDILHI